MRILCIEDDPDLRADLIEELHALGHYAYGAADGTLGLAIVQTEKFDLVFCDVLLPGISGQNVLMEMRNNAGPNALTPFVVLTAYCDPAMEAECLALGATGFIKKPVDYDQLPTLIEVLSAAAEIAPDTPGNAI